MTCWGVYREAAHSPGRIDDDAAILERVGAALAERGFGVELVEADALSETPSANVFVMCERGAILDRLAAMEKSGSIVVNSPAAIRNTYRHRMIELFAQRQVPAPLSRIVATEAMKPRPADCMWVKRYDFHATEPEDVMYVASESGWREALRGFAARGIPFVVAQEHVAGDLVKFYGVRGGAWAPSPTGSSGSIIATKACWAIRSKQPGCTGLRSTPPPRSGSRFLAATPSSGPAANR